VSHSLIRVLWTTDMSLAEINASLLPPAADLARVQATVDAMVTEIRHRRDTAVLEFTQRFDWPDATLAALRVTREEIARGVAETDPAVCEALVQAAAHIRAFHARQMPHDFFDELEPGLKLGQRHTPVESVACYVPTRKASIPSSVLMSVVPAQVAGVPRIVVVGPCRLDGTLPAGVLAAADALGITEIYKLGGAVAMAALGLGTPTFPKVDKIVGPANIFGTLAKKALYGDVGVDGLYGPSEVVVIADGSVDPVWIATDLMSQSEHGEDSQSVLITPDPAYAQAVLTALSTSLAASSRAQYLAVALAERGALVIARDLAEATELANLLAPEHLELAVATPEALLPFIRHAGSILMGGTSPVPVGDYFAGPSHILPTGRTARFSSGLGVHDFLKRSSLIQASSMWMTRHQRAITTLADHEGLEAHAQAVRLRGGQA
jgi:histidinol dehydrogenase